MQRKSTLSNQACFEHRDCGASNLSFWTSDKQNVIPGLPTAAFPHYLTLQHQFWQSVNRHPANVATLFKPCMSQLGLGTKTLNPQCAVCTTDQGGCGTSTGLLVAIETAASDTACKETVACCTCSGSGCCMHTGLLTVPDTATADTAQAKHAHNLSCLSCQLSTV